MTSVSTPQPTNLQSPSSSTQSVAPAQPHAAGSGTSSPQASAGRGFHNAARKPGSIATPTGAPHGRSESTSAATEKSAIPPAVPYLGGPTIVNGSNAVSANPHASDHTRKSSLTISASGSVGQMPNGGPVGGKPASGNNIQFGSIGAGASPAMASSATHPGPAGSLATPPDPRVTSPAQSPSPIPQPPVSGGRPPSGLHGQGNGMTFGSMGGGPGEDPSVGSFASDETFSLTMTVQRQSRANAPTGAMNSSMSGYHLRRESSQSSHPEMGNSAAGPNGGRGAYNMQQGGRGRGYQYHPQPSPFSPGQQGFRGPPNGPRGGQNMSPFPGPPGRPLGPGYPSPHQSARSPALAHAQPMHVPPGQMPVASPGMPQTPYGGYAHPMGHQQVKPNSSSASVSVHSGGRKAPGGVTATTAPVIVPAVILPTDLSPESGHFEQFLISKTSQTPSWQQFNPQLAYYDPHMQSMQVQQMQMQGFASPRPPYNSNVPPNPQTPYMTGQYPGQPMSRTPSEVSNRPNSAIGHPPTPMTPAVNQAAANRGANPSPAPKNSNFKLPSKKSVGIAIRDPKTGEALDFAKSKAESPATVAPSVSPTPPAETSTPPASTPSAQHVRTESQNTKTTDEKRHDMKDAVARRLKEAAEEEKRLKEVKAREEEEVAMAQREEKEAKEKAETASAPAAEAKETKPAAPSAAPVIMTGDSDEEAQSEPEPAPAPAPPQENLKPADRATSKEPSAASSVVDEDDEEMWRRIEAEEEERERERERKYQERKAAEAETKAKNAAEEAARLDAELKRQEREAEAIEEARLKKAGNAEDTDREERQDLFASLKKSENAFKATQTTQTPPTNDTPAESGTATPKSDASMGPPPRGAAASKQKALKPEPLRLETSKPVEAPQPSAALQSLRSARFLTVINDKTYPAAIASPNPAINSAAPMGKFRYDKNFLLQFQNVFIEKPSETWVEKIKETVGDTSDTPSSARPRQGGTMPPRSTSNRGTGMGASVQFGGGAGAFGNFGTARTLPPGTTSQARYEASLQGQRPQPSGTLRYNANAPGGFPMGFPAPMSRTASSTSIGHPQSPRTNPSHRGSGRGSKAGTKRDTDKEAKTMPLTAGMDLKPIEVSASGWKPRSVGVNANAAGPPPGGASDYLAPDVVQRKVKAALNKMTPTTFNKIAGQIMEVVMQSKRETDGRSLRQVIQLTFEKATDEAHWAEMYAQFCSHMLENMTPEIKDETLGLDKHGNVNAGSTLFRKYLLNRCQQDFEAGWKSKLPEKPEGKDGEAAMLSDEYYVAAAAKRRGLGLVKFIGELFKLGMLTSRIMHMCILRLLDYEGVPDEAEVESLTSLLKTIGNRLDSEEKGRPSMDAYFQRVNTMINVEGLPSRLKFMLMVSLPPNSLRCKSLTAIRTLSTCEERAGEPIKPPRVPRRSKRSAHRYVGSCMTAVII